MSRPSRRAVRPAGTVGGDEADLRRVLPAASAGPVGRASRPIAHPPVPDGPALPGRSADDGDLGWGDPRDADEDRLVREKPPHWA